MRKAFFSTLLDLMERDPSVTLVTGDMGFGLVEPLVARVPAQVVNAGIAEQTMTGIAAGLALSGRTAFTYSIANFPTLRCLEQIRNDVCYHRANVKVVSVGAGLNYGALGATHHAAEDLAIMRALPNMTVLAPGDPVESALATRAACGTPGPVYLRIGRGGEPVVHERDVEFRIGRAIQVREGSDAAILATGSMLHSAVQAAELLAAEGVRASVHSFHTIKPLDEAAVRAIASRAPVLVTLEEHSVLGGLGGAVAEVLAESALADPPAFKRIGIPSVFASKVGGHEFLRRQFGLTPEQVAAQVLALVQRRIVRPVTRPSRPTGA